MPKKPAKKSSVGKKKIGRPCEYSQEIATKLFKRIESGESVRSICKDKSMPGRTTINTWLRTPEMKDFRNQYESSTEIGLAQAFEELDEIAKDESIDVMRARLIIDTRKWSLSKQLPKKYGEKVGIEHSGEIIINRVVFGGQSQH